MFRKSLGVTLVVAITIVLAISLLTKERKWSKKITAYISEGQNSEQGTSLFYFGGEVYAVPKMYWPGETQQEANHSYAAFNLSMLLPDFTPAAENPKKFNEVGWHNQLTVLVEYGTHFITPEDWITQYDKWGNLKKDSWVLAPNGCQLFRGNFLDGKELYYCSTDFGTIVFTCKTQDEFPSPSCTSRENIGDKTTIIYHYSRLYVDKAISIDAKIRALLQTFRVSR